MIKKIYFVQQKKYYGYDSSEDENIEECMIIGYFTSLTFVEKVKQVCIKNGIDKLNFDVQIIDVNLSNNQKFIYVLSHMYSILKEDGTYTDYEYIFEPQSNIYKAKELMDKLKLNSKYQFKSNRIYEDYSLNGFVIDKFKLDFMYYPIVQKIGDTKKIYGEL